MVGVNAQLVETHVVGCVPTVNVKLIVSQLSDVVYPLIHIPSVPIGGDRSLPHPTSVGTILVNQRPEVKP